jgi:hypothetical protein
MHEHEKSWTALLKKQITYHPPNMFSVKYYHESIIIRVNFLQIYLDF